MVGNTREMLGKCQENKTGEKDLFVRTYIQKLVPSCLLQCSLVKLQNFFCFLQRNYHIHGVSSSLGGCMAFLRPVHVHIHGCQSLPSLLAHLDIFLAEA